eukprot:COSAG04_NODE_1013_length_8768_cov_10.694544_3_plen_211_part_00
MANLVRATIWSGLLRECAALAGRHTFCTRFAHDEPVCCRAHAVYRQTTGYHHVLFRPAGEDYWVAGHEDRRWDCYPRGYLSSDEGNCPNNPSGCNTHWKYWSSEHHRWLHDSSIRVTAGGSSYYSSLALAPTKESGAPQTSIFIGVGFLGTLVVAAAIMRRRRNHTATDTTNNTVESEPLATSDKSEALNEGDSEEEADGERAKLGGGVV